MGQDAVSNCQAVLGLLPEAGRRAPPRGKDEVLYLRYKFLTMLLHGRPSGTIFIEQGLSTHRRPGTLHRPLVVRASPGLPAGLLLGWASWLP